jgi:hypothetical protein
MSALSLLQAFLGSSVWWMLGSTPPAAMVTASSRRLSSSSLRTASWMWRSTMRDLRPTGMIAGPADLGPAGLLSSTSDSMQWIWTAAPATDLDC